MFEKIKNWLGKNRLSKNWLQPQRVHAEPPSIELSTTVLLLDIAAADGNIDELEITGIQDLLRREFDQDQETLRQTMNTAIRLLHEAVDMFDYSRVVCSSLPVARRERILAGMWQVALADGYLDRFEEGRLRKLSDLMGLSHSEFMQAKHQAMG